MTMWVDMVGATAASEHPAETFEYLTYLCSYEAGMDIWQVRKSVPGCRPDVWNSEEALADEHFKVYSDMLNESGMPPKLPRVDNFRVNEYWQVINEGLEPIWVGEQTFDEVVDSVIQAGQEVLDKPSLVG
jgi:ABC-type glycerol-3-phosphate transport system substrate-binding protein